MIWSLQGTCIPEATVATTIRHDQHTDSNRSADIRWLPLPTLTDFRILEKSLRLMLQHDLTGEKG